MNYLSKPFDQLNPEHILKYIAQDHYEKFHLKFIKWSLSVHYKASNIGCWGESGRHPLYYEACKLAIDYFSRVESSENDLIAAAYFEQVSLELPWYKNISKLLNKYGSTIGHNPKAKLSTQITHSMREEFVEVWKRGKASSPKLDFYNEIKHEFTPEKYLSSIKIPDACKSLTRLRISCHNLYVERGRYETPLVPREKRWCVHCFYSTGTKNVEDENHVLIHCPLYSPIREKFENYPKNESDLAGLLSDLNSCPNKTTSFARAVNSILSTNESYTAYYKMSEFHNKTGNCVIL